MSACVACAAASCSDFEATPASGSESGTHSGEEGGAAVKGGTAAKGGAAAAAAAADGGGTRPPADSSAGSAAAAGGAAPAMQGSDPDPPNGDSTAAGSPGAGGNAGASAHESTGGDASADGTAGGAPAQAPPAGGACLSCGAAACGPTLTSCEKNPECAPWLGCIEACDSPACSRACDATFADAARVYYGVYACLCKTCEASCAVADSCQKQCRDDGLLPPSDVAPATLAETGLYANAASTANVAPHVYLYQAKFPLWADDAGKDRYVFLPRCSTIDTADMDHWQFPVGTRLWKHFSVDGKRIETRMLHRYGSGNDDWLYATYGWDETKPDDPRAAVAVLHGSPNANGTLHDIPDPSACPACHGKLPDKPLGFSAFQLSHSGAGLNMQRLSDWGILSVPSRQGFAVPGTPVQQAALGYLHGNCGGCHNSFGAIPRENPMKLRLLVAQTKYPETDTVQTTVGVPTINTYPELYGRPRIDPQAPASSAIYLRMSDRNKFPMPPLATKFADVDGGVAAVAAWIDSLNGP